MKTVRPLLQIFIQENREFLARSWRNRLAICQNGMLERVTTTAVLCGRHCGYGRANYLSRVLRVLMQNCDNLFDGDIVMALAPAVVIGDHSHGGVTDLSLSSELRLLKIGHANHI